MSHDKEVRPLAPPPAGLEEVDHPKHYTSGKIEVIEFLEDQQLPFHLANVVKYVTRAGKKLANSELVDLKKAQWYLNRYINLKERKE